MMWFRACCSLPSAPNGAIRHSHRLQTSTVSPEQGTHCAARQGTSTGKALENGNLVALKWELVWLHSYSSALCREFWAQEQAARLAELLPCFDSLSRSGDELGFAVLEQGTKKLLCLCVCLQMGHSWLWCRSETESPSDSEKNSDFQSVLSWDSSLDLELGSWRNTEEAALGKLEESSQEADYRLKFSDPLWEDDSEDYPKAERQCEDESLLQFFSEVGLRG